VAASLTRRDQARIKALARPRAAASFILWRMCALATSSWRRDPTLRQFVKYGVVGASNTVLTFVTYTVLEKLVGINYLIALPLGYGVGSLNSYVLNRHWTFQAADIAHTTAGTRFAIVQVVAIAANELLLYVFVHHLGIEKIAAQAILTVPVLAVTFVANRWWSFARPREQPPAAT
jgi:putative flippase GtrA